MFQSEKQYDLYSNQLNKKQLFVIIISIFIGILAAYGGILFRYMIFSVHWFYFLTHTYTLELLYQLSWQERLLYPTSGGLIVGYIVAKFAPEVKGSGIPEVIKSIALNGGVIRFRVLITKAISASITIGSGGSAGREGPIVHIGAAVASVIGQFLNASTKHMRTYVACGAASAIAATFNAPFSGALFALEVVMGEMNVVSMPPVIISSVIATVISRYHLGDFPAFEVPVYELNFFSYELVFYGILGILAGGVAILFIHLFLKTSKFFDSLPLPIWIKPAIGGFCVGLIALYVPHIFGVGYATVNSALWGELDIYILGIVLIAKIIATSITLGSGGSGGVFAPSLFIGAALGGAWGHLIYGLWPEYTSFSGAYALVGMGAVVAAVTHAPISAIFIIFELTNSYLILTPLMVSCIIAVFLSHHYLGKSIYLAKLESGGIHIYDKKNVNLLHNIKIHHVMDNNPILIHEGLSFSEVIKTLLNEKRPSGIVVNDQQSYIGTIRLNDIRESLPLSDVLSPLVIAKDIANSSVPYVLQNHSLDLVMHIFAQTDQDELAVCNNRTQKKVIAVITKSSLINAYHTRIFQEDLIGGFQSIMSSSNEGQTIEVFSGFYLGEIDVFHTWIGKSISQIDLRKKYGLEIVLLQRLSDQHLTKNHHIGVFPAPDLVLHPGDRLLVLGKKESIHQLMI